MTPTVDQAITLHRAGRLADAEQCYREILGATPDTVAALKGLGVILLQTGRVKDAVDYLAKAVERKPGDVDALNNFGAAQHQCGRLQDARETYETAIALAPNLEQGRANLGVVLYDLGELNESAHAFEAAIAADPNNANTHYNYSRTLKALGRLDDAEAAARKALVRAPSYVNARVSLGLTQAAKGDSTAAEESYRAALHADPRAAEAHHNLAQILLQSGRLTEGWEAFEWRWHTSDFQGAETFRALTSWEGDTLSEGTLLVWTEQGVGDQILYASMIHDLKDMAPNIMLACTARLVPIFSRSFPFAEVLSQAALKENQDLLRPVVAQVPAGSLGQFLRPSINSYPSRGAFLHANPKKVLALRAKYETQFGDTARIGLSWRSANPRFGASKSMMLDDLKPALSHPGTTYFDLQYGDTDEERSVFAEETGIEVFRDTDIDALIDLEGFAALVASMDLVITSSNTTAHVAGALGVPCWTLVPAGPGLLWYWFLDRSDSPWYPSLRLFRQAFPGDWVPAVQQVSEALSGFLSVRPGSS